MGFFFKAYLSALLFPKKKSIIVIQKVSSNFIYAGLLKLLVICRKERSVYDLDDSDYFDYSTKSIFFFARHCAKIACGSHAIAEYLRQLNPNVFHITSPIHDLNIVKKERSPLFTIGWLGSFGWGHKDSLKELVFPAVRNMPFACRFAIIGVTTDHDEQEIRSYFSDFPHIQIFIPREVNWLDEKSLQERIIQFDVGVATLLNHPAQISKSGIKAKQYMNNGIPVLSNNLPENNRVVIHGYNGFLCDSPAEFEEKLIMFKEMSDSEYSCFSNKARNSIKNFNSQKYFEDYAQMFRYQSDN